MCFQQGTHSWRESCDLAASDFVPSEKLILFAFRAVGAFEATNQEHSHTQGYQDGEHARIRSDPVNQIMHTHPRPASAPNPPSWIDTGGGKKARSRPRSGGPSLPLN